VELDDFRMGGRRVRAAVAKYPEASRASWRELKSTPTVYCIAGRSWSCGAVPGILRDGTATSDEVADIYTIQDGEVPSMHATTDVEARLLDQEHS
jgi:hypothetical protein